MNKLKEMRKKSGKRQIDVAKELGVSKCALWYYETEQRKLSLDMAKKIAKIYGCTIDDLV